MTELELALAAMDENQVIAAYDAIIRERDLSVVHREQYAELAVTVKAYIEQYYGDDALSN